MNETTASAALTGLLAALVHDAEELRCRIDLAADDLSQGSRNGCMGALGGTDEIIERMAATISATRAIHIATRTL